MATTDCTQVRAGSAERPDWHSVLDIVGERFPAVESAGSVYRIAEFAVALLALIVTAPVIAVVAVLIRLDSRGPALFRQVRVGRGGRLFTFVKFRTFWHDAVQRHPHLYNYRFSEGEIAQFSFKNPGDPRATRMGRWLRRTTIDELPNFWNVLTGDMTLVGPRPELPEMLPYYSDEHLLKFSVKPGLTGLAQTSGRGHLRFLEAAQLDAEYVRSRSLKGDLRILWRTAVIVLRREGAF
jgi:lipopolysaccharide/colanic/teichoic acid biosynthesis glycosyltransferase